MTVRVCGCKGNECHDAYGPECQYGVGFAPIKRPGFDFRGRPIREVARDALHRTPGVECDHVDYREPCCERDGAHVATAIEAHLLSDEVSERAGYASWVVHLEQSGLQGTDAEYRFGWDHLPPSHRDAWIKRAQRIIMAAVGPDLGG